MSVPSENKGYYFSGSQRKDGGVIDVVTEPNITANSLVSVDLSKFDEPSFASDNLTGVTGRSSAELVWLPVSDGVLVAIGGVTNPESIHSSSLSSSEKEENVSLSPWSQHILLTLLLTPFNRRRKTPPLWRQLVYMMSALVNGKIQMPSG